MITEAGAGYKGNPDLVKQSALEGGRIEPGVGHLRERIERPIWYGAAKARQAVQAVDDLASALIKHRNHLRDGVLRTCEGGQAGELTGGRDTGMAVDGHANRRFDQIGRPNAIA